uniref:hypothetical protein n=1 Tax=Arthrobacter silvisoli TaxID=2291022 RepID=UPI003F498658
MLAVPANDVLGHEHPGAGHFPGNLRMSFVRGYESDNSRLVFRVAILNDALKHAPSDSAHGFAPCSRVLV